MFNLILQLETISESCGVSKQGYCLTDLAKSLQTRSDTGHRRDTEGKILTALGFFAVGQFTVRKKNLTEPNLI